MAKVKSFLTVLLCISALTACISSGPNYQNFQSYYPMYSNQPYYGQGYPYAENYEGRQSTAVVPSSYYTGDSRSPTSHKDMDKNWVNGQNPKSYTIQIGDSDQASQVAGRLYKTPKADRSAQIKYNREGRNYYKGVYGSYNNYEDAQKALNNLPPEIKEGANIKSWGSVQENTQ